MNRPLEDYLQKKQRTVLPVVSFGERGMYHAFAPQYKAGIRFGNMTVAVSIFMRFRLKKLISLIKAIHIPLQDDGWQIRLQTQLRLQIYIFSCDMETWTGFLRIQAMMAYNQCLG